ncbi:MAG: (deoxy)nucleoside triphosphate pyrophosphohydrolase [Geobacter sp.]|nr:(deoxy)nucleoside triphosphate pyrophosphohydrolase [Geobacter sp.]
MSDRKIPLKVTCAIIEKEGKVLAAQRSERMSHPLKWEFPGGKLHEGESLEDCLVREIREELGIEVQPLVSLPPLVHHYDHISVELLPFICRIVQGEIVLHEHSEVSWLEPEELSSLDWVEADVPVFRSYLDALERRVSSSLGEV